MAAPTVNRYLKVEEHPTTVTPVEQPTTEKAGFFRRLLTSLMDVSHEIALYRLEHQYPALLTPAEKAQLAREKTRRDFYLLGIFH